MNKPKNKGGRPKGPPTTTVSFQADAQVMEAIEKLARELDGAGIPPGSVKAVAIRRALLSAAEGR